MNIAENSLFFVESLIIRLELHPYHLEVKKRECLIFDYIANY
jgi:hypothetical protein